MHCAVGLLPLPAAALFICKDGPVFALARVEPLVRAREL